MRDEEYEFFSDCREKKSTAASAFKRRTHTGKGGRVRFPSDHLSKKELEKMNGETKSYRLNEPMSWQEFKAMPEDIQKMYLTLLIKKYNPSASDIGKMMGCCGQSVLNWGKKLGIVFERRGGQTEWDKEGWYAWISGTPKPAEEVTEAEAEEILEILGEEEVPFTQKPIGQIVEEALANVVEEEPEMPKAEPVVEHHVCKCQMDRKTVVPMTGNMVFEGLAEDVLETVRVLLGGAKVHISVTWDVVED